MTVDYMKYTIKKSLLSTYTYAVSIGYGGCSGFGDRRNLKWF